MPRAMADPLNVMWEAVKRTLERTPPELAADIAIEIMLAGCGASGARHRDRISHRNRHLHHVAQDPLLCVVNGCGHVP